MFQLKWLLETHVPSAATRDELDAWLQAAAQRAREQRADEGRLQQELEAYQAKLMAELKPLREAVGARVRLLKPGFLAWVEERRVGPAGALTGEATEHIGQLVSIVSTDRSEYVCPEGYFAPKDCTVRFHERTVDGRTWHLTWADSVNAAVEKYQQAVGAVVARVQQACLSDGARALVSAPITFAGALNVGIIQPARATVFTTRFTPYSEQEERMRRSAFGDSSAVTSPLTDTALQYESRFYHRKSVTEVVPELRVEGLLLEADASSLSFLVYPGANCLDLLDLGVLSGQTPQPPPSAKSSPRGSRAMSRPRTSHKGSQLAASSASEMRGDAFL